MGPTTCYRGSFTSYSHCFINPVFDNSSTLGLLKRGIIYLASLYPSSLIYTHAHVLKHIQAQAILIYISAGPQLQCTGKAFPVIVFMRLSVEFRI
jgi:hypothetical protein